MTTSVSCFVQDLGDIGGRPGRLGDDLGEIFAQAVVRHAAMDLDAEIGHVGELDGVVLTAADGFAEIFADLFDVDIEGGGELDVADVIAAEIDVHQARHELVVRGILVILDALNERRGAVTDADNGDAHLIFASNVHSCHWSHDHWYRLSLLPLLLFS